MAPLPTDSTGALTSPTTAPSADKSTSESPSAIEAAVPPKPVTVVRKHAQRTRFRRGLRVIGSVVSNILTAIWICLLYGIPGFVVLVVVVVPMIGLSLACVAANGAIALLTGNAILRAGHLAHYTTNAVAAEIGAIGGVISAFIFGLLSQCLPHNEKGELWWPFNLVGSLIVSTLAGTIGCAILQRNHTELHGIDVLHATRAGALGGSILGLGMIFAVPFIFAALFIILSPLLIAMKLGLRWVYVRSSESWSDRGTYRSSYCYSYGTCGDDSDIEEELAQIPQHRRF